MGIMCHPPGRMAPRSVHDMLVHCVDRVGAAEPPLRRAGHCICGFCLTLLLQPVQVCVW